MAIKLQRLNVVKVVESEFKAKALERHGFIRVDDKPTKGKKANEDQSKGTTDGEGGK